MLVIVKDVFRSIQGSYSAIWSLPFTNVMRHSDPRPVTVTSQLIRLFTKSMTLIPNLTITELRVVSMEHLQWVLHASREHLPFQTPGFVPFWDFLMLQLLRPVFPNLLCLFSTFHLECPSVLFLFCFNLDYEV